MVFTGSVQPLAETGTVFGSGDVADDSAIWVNPADPTQSFIIGESKAPAGGLHVYNLSGAEVSRFPLNAPIGNIDVSGNIVAGVNRATDHVEVFRISTAGVLTKIGTFATGLIDVYGFTMGVSPTSGNLYAFVSTEGGAVRQFDVTVGTSSVSATTVRNLSLGSQTEGMAIDEAKSAVYIAVEATSLFRYGLEPSTGTARTTVDTVGSNGLEADLEGVAIYDRPDGSGYVLLSSQGNSTFKVYDRNTNAFLGTFSVGASANGAVDAVTGSDGIEISSTNLGGAYSQGLFVAHDESNSGGTTSNYKLVPWSSIQALIGGEPPTPTNQAPAAGADKFTLAKDAVLTVPAPGVLENDTDPDGDPLTAAVATGPAHGSLVLNANGSLTYTPALQYTGPDGFTYTVSDGTATATGTVDLTIDPVSLPSDEAIVGTRRADVLTSTDADETISGGKGGDTFVFDGSFGHDHITDFRAGSGQHDVIETHAFTSFDHLLEHTSQVGADTVIAYGPDNTITLVNLQISQLRAADFDFV